MFRNLRILSRCVRYCSRCRNMITSRPFVGGMLISAAGVTVNDNSGFAKLEVNKEHLSDSYLTKMASVQAVNASSALLTQSLCILLDVMDRYADLLKVLVQLMELQLEVFGIETKEAKVWDAIMEIRKQINECKAEKVELEAIFSSAEKALQASGEAAHMTGAIYAGVAANERLFSATSQLNHRRSIVEKAEIKLRQVEAKCIKKFGKKDEQTKSNNRHVINKDDLLSEEKTSDQPNHAAEYNKQPDEEDDAVIIQDIFENKYTENSEKDFSFK